MPTLRRAPKKAMSHKASSSPRIVSSDEKRQLILAHAAQRRPVDPVQRMSLWAGVFVCVVFVIGAWFYTVGSGIRDSFARTPDRLMMYRGGEEPEDTSPALPTNILTEEGSRSLQDGFKEVEERLDELTAEQQIVDAMADQINASSTAAATSTRDLFEPQTTSTPEVPEDSGTPEATEASETPEASEAPVVSEDTPVENVPEENTSDIPESTISDPETP
jgi:hypothetical protein